MKVLSVFKSRNPVGINTFDSFGEVVYASFLEDASVDFVPFAKVENPFDGYAFLSSIPDILSYDLIVFSDETVVKESAMIFAGKLGLGLIAHSNEIISNNGIVMGKVLGWDNFEALVSSKTKPSLMIFSSKQGYNYNSCDSPTKVRYEKTKSIAFIASNPLPLNPLSEARVVVCVGRGVRESILPKVRQFASLINAEICCTRPVADSGLMGQDRVVGDTGISIKPDLYIAFGVSGAIQHLTQVNAKHIVAFNTDAKAPIFGKADLGINLSMEDVIDELLIWARNFSK
ncbi:MAG: FAD-binding protein [Caldisericaceae bacterium]